MLISILLVLYIISLASGFTLPIPVPKRSNLKMSGQNLFQSYFLKARDTLSNFLSSLTVDTGSKDLVLSELRKISETQTTIIGSINKNKEDSDRRLEESDKRLEESDKRLEESDKRLEESDKRFDSIDKHLIRIIKEADEMKKFRKETKSLFNSLGRSLEYSTRSFLTNAKGSDFVKPLKVRSIIELAEIALPTNKPSPSELKTDSIYAKDENSLLQERAVKLYNKAKFHIPALIDWANVSSNSTNKKTRSKALSIKSLLESYEKSNDHFKKKALLYGPLGFQAFSREALISPVTKGYISELQFDLKGSMYYAGNFIRSEIVEVKLKGRDEAIDQILKRMAVVYAAQRAILTEEDLVQTELHYNGILSSNNIWETPTYSEISDKIKALGLDLPPKYVSMEALLVE